MLETQQIIYVSFAKPYYNYTEYYPIMQITDINCKELPKIAGQTYCITAQKPHAQHQIL